MNKKDRIAVVVTVLALFFGVIFTNVNGAGTIPPISALLTTLLYWAYRFIKNDISFLKIKDA
jgi:uncharacterized membrane protein